MFNALSKLPAYKQVFRCCCTLGAHNNHVTSDSVAIASCATPACKNRDCCVVAPYNDAFISYWLSV
jgi:hypothetical protein